MRYNYRLCLQVIALSVVVATCTPNEGKINMEKDIEYPLYSEPYRPQFHFSPERQWMNDPNGMVYYEGEYHLFYQFYPDSNVWGPMHWGHAISTNLIEWEHMPIALYPDSIGYIFSGSAVIDWNNTSGFGTEDNPAMIAIYTYHDPVGEKEKTIDFQTQGIAYSLDKGRSWTKYENNPVLKNPGIRDFRDPKVVWFEKENKWIMTLAVKDHVSFYSSPDLKQWTFESDFGKDYGVEAGVWECPDMFPMLSDNGEEKWVMLLSINPGAPQGGSGTMYFIGNFDGNTFTPQDNEIRWLDYGADNYAGVTWSDIPEDDGRSLFIGWMSNWQYATQVPTEVWRSAMTIPRSLKLININGKLVIQSKPVSELESIYGNSKPIKEEEEIALTEKAFLIELGSPDSQGNIMLTNDLSETLSVSWNSEELVIDRSEAGESDFNNSFAAIHKSPMSSMKIENIKIFVDASSIEVFVNDGMLVMTDLVFPTSNYSQIRIEGSEFAELTKINSIWR